MNILRELFSGKNNRLSSKRISGVICITNSIAIYWAGYGSDISVAAQYVMGQFLTAGLVLLGAGLLERTEPPYSP